MGTWQEVCLLVSLGAIMDVEVVTFVFGAIVYIKVGTFVFVAVVLIKVGIFGYVAVLCIEVVTFVLSAIVYVGVGTFVLGAIVYIKVGTVVFVLVVLIEVGILRGYSAEQWDQAFVHRRLCRCWRAFRFPSSRFPDFLPATLRVSSSSYGPLFVFVLCLV